MDVETGGQKSADFNHAWVAEALAQGTKRSDSSSKTKRYGQDDLLCYVWCSHLCVLLSFLFFFFLLLLFSIGAARMGVYASAYEWGQVMGSHAGFTSYPLWYPDYVSEKGSMQIWAGAIM